MKESALLAWPLLTIPGAPPSWKSHMKIVRFGGRPGLIKSSRSREWSEMAVLALKSQWGDRKAITESVQAWFTVYVPSERTPLDWDNAVAGPCDMLAEAGILVRMQKRGAVEVNRGDWLIRHGYVDMAVDKKNPRVEIVLREGGRWPVERL